MSKDMIPDGSMAVRVIKHAGASVLVSGNHPTDGLVMRQVPAIVVKPVGISPVTMTVPIEAVSAGIPFGVNWKAAYMVIKPKQESAATTFASAMSRRKIVTLADARANMALVNAALQEAHNTMVIDIVNAAESLKNKK